MRGLKKYIYILIVFCMIFSALPANAFLFQKKDYKQIFLHNALDADKRNNLNSAFYNFEKALYYYKKDKKVIETYAQFCERHKFFEKSEELYSKLYILTKDPKYLFKKNLSTIKTGALTDKELQNLTVHKLFTPQQKIELNEALIFHFSYKQNWKDVHLTCKKIPTNKIGKDTIISCIVSSRKLSDNKYLLDLYMRFSDINPNNSEIVNKILSIAEKTNNYALQEKYIKRLSAQNPKDFGIKYKLAGFYEKNSQWAKASKVYKDLLKSGDKSSHVKNSLAYVNSQLSPKKQEQGLYVPYKEIPLSGYKLQEKLFYEALDKKDYKPAMAYLDKMLKYEPNNQKLLRHKVDIYFATENYTSALEIFEKLERQITLNSQDYEFLAYLYSLTGNLEKTNQIMENLLKSNPNDQKLLTLAMNYSMTAKDWDKALEYNQKLLEQEPNSEKFLKTAGDLYSAKNDFPTAIEYYEKLVRDYSSTEYQYNLSNLYMANQEFTKAEAILEPLYKEFGDNSEIISAYLNSLLAQQKLAASYWVIKDKHLEKTKTGYMVLGDMSMKDKDYKKASENYQQALRFEPQSSLLQNKLADSYRMQGYKYGPEKMFKAVLANEPKNPEAKLGLGSLETERKNFNGAREIFTSILKENPNYRPAKIAMAHSYLANGDKLAALTVLGPLVDDDETNLLKAKTYYDMNMLSDAKSSLKGSVTKEAEELRYKIKRDNAVIITPSYDFFLQQLADEYNLDYHKFGLNVTKNIKNNSKIFLDYNVIVYSSGSKYFFNNVVNEFRGGIQSRPERDWEYRADIGVKAFEFGGGLINTDSWIKHYFNDKFTLKLGIKRDNIEQSYLSAVGAYIDGTFIGRSAYNKVYLEYEGKLPFQIYTYGYGGYGLVTSGGLNNNQYFEALFGIGKFLYNNPKNKWFNTCSFDVVSYNMGYQYNQLNLPAGKDLTFGGYYSPSYFNATTGNLKFEGNIKKWNLKYGLKAFGGPQTAMSPDQLSLAWGWSPYIAYDVNDHISINASYNHFVYASLIRDVFLIKAEIRGFKKHAKG